MNEGYYRLIKPLENLEDFVGDLFYLTGVDGAHVYMVNGDEKWTIDLVDFDSGFEFAPDGAKERVEQIASFTKDLHQIGVDNTQLLVQSDQLLLTDSKTEGLTPTNRGIAPAQVQSQLKEIKTKVGKTKMLIEKQQRAMARLVKEQEMILEEKVLALSKQIKVANEAIEIITTYLGQDEEIIKIKSGKPAPKETLITIRQKLLYMDEECMIAADKGGIDFRNVEAFDKWIAQPKHLEQILPEPKGVVALKIRRSNKRYGCDWFTEGMLNEQNKQLYILIRNGGTLYRIFSTLELEEVLLPTKAEFEECFYEKRYDWETKTDKVVPLRPGSVSYAKAMEEAQDKQRQYFKVLMMLQGLLDRTKVFEPLPCEHRLNLCNIDECDEYVRVIYDAEGLLGDGKLPYDDWLEQANSRMEVGHRVIGIFDSYGSSYDRRERISPSGAYTPDDKVLYTLEGKRDNGFLFRYKRTGEVYSWTKGYTQAKNRASFLCKPHDEFILNFDEVTVEEMEYYISSRIHRHHYIKMIPLMRAAIELKKQEVQDEIPFRQLLIGEIAKTGVTHEEAEDKIDELIKWWKYKNFTHRALTSDDSKAARMIVAEFGRRKLVESQKTELAEEHQQIVDLFRKEPVLSIWHRKNNEYVVLRAMNDESIFVREEHWKNSDGLRCYHEKDWTVVDKRHESWQLLYADSRWTNWTINARSQDHLTDPEREIGIDTLVKSLVSKKPTKHSNKKGVYWRVPLAVTLHERDTICLWAAYQHADYNPKKPLTETPTDPEVGFRYLKWTKTKGKVEFHIAEDQIVCINIEKPNWELGFKKEYSWQKGVIKQLRMFEENLQALKSEFRGIDLAKEEADKLREAYRSYQDQVQQALMDQFYEIEKQKFFEDYQDEEMWLEHKKELRNHHCWPSWLGDVLDVLIENGYNPDGMTIEQAVITAEDLGHEMPKHEKDHKKVWTLVLDKSFKETEE